MREGHNFYTLEKIYRVLINLGSMRNVTKQPSSINFMKYPIKNHHQYS